MKFLQFGLPLLCLLFISGCDRGELSSLSLYKNDKTVTVSLYKDFIEPGWIIAIFPSSLKEAAMMNCESTIELFEQDDRDHGYINLITGAKPHYYCV